MIKVLRYKKQDLPIRISYLAIKMTSLALGKDITKVDIQAFNPEEIETMLYWALKSGANALELDFNIPRDEMELVLDEFY